MRIIISSNTSTKNIPYPCSLSHHPQQDNHLLRYNAGFDSHIYRYAHTDTTLEADNPHLHILQTLIGENIATQQPKFLSSFRCSKPASEIHFYTLAEHQLITDHHSNSHSRSWTNVAETGFHCTRFIPPENPTKT